MIDERCYLIPETLELVYRLIAEKVTWFLRLELFCFEDLVFSF